MARFLKTLALGVALVGLTSCGNTPPSEGEDVFTETVQVGDDTYFCIIYSHHKYEEGGIWCEKIEDGRE